MHFLRWNLILAKLQLWKELALSANINHDRENPDREYYCKNILVKQNFIDRYLGKSADYIALSKKPFSCFLKTKDVFFPRSPSHPK